MTQPWPVQITALTPTACGAARWRTSGTSWITVIVKATFDLVHGGLATLTTPREIVREDRYRERTGSLEEASETAPYLPGTGVLLVGHAYAPGGRAAPTAAARLAIVRERPLLDKTVHIFGDRPHGATHAQPFQKMPLVYERAYGGAGMPENPVGLGLVGTAAQPNVVDSTNPQKPAGFGPISRYWPARKRLLGSGDERGLLGSDPAIPEGFDWRYFHAAPPDQQIAQLRGDEWLVLDGLHPVTARIQTRLPSAVGRARWHLATSSGVGPAQPIDLVADTLFIDADRLACSVVWRGRFALTRPDLAPWVRVFAGVELGGQPIVWVRPQDAAAVELGVAETVAGPLRLGPNGPLPAQSKAASLAGTSELDLRAVLATILPFGTPDPGRVAPAAVKTEAPRPVITRAPEALTGTGEMDLRHVLSAIVPFQPAKRAPSPLASTGGMDGVRMGPALPFTPSHPSTPVFAATPQPLVARVPSSLGGTADEDMQQAMRAILPFMGTAKSRPGVVETTRPPVQVIEPPAPLPEPAPPLPVYAPPMMQAPPTMQAPPMMQAPPLMQAPLMQAPPPPVEPARQLGSFAIAPVPVTVPAPLPAVSPVPPAAPPPAPAASVKAATAEAPVSLRDQVLARLQAGQSLQGLSLVAADLHDVDFKASSLSGLDLRRSNLRSANLAGVQAAEIQLESADLTDANLEGADLNRANLSRATVTKASFKGANLTGANLQRLVGDAPSFHAARLQGADLRQAQIPGAIFDEAGLRNASTTKADLTGSRFIRADLAGANLRESKLCEANFAHANLDGADLRDADLARTNVFRASRKGAKISPAQVKDLLEIDPELDSTSRKEG